MYASFIHLIINNIYYEYLCLIYTNNIHYEDVCLIYTHLIINNIY